MIVFSINIIYIGKKLLVESKANGAFRISLCNSNLTLKVPQPRADVRLEGGGRGIIIIYLQFHIIYASTCNVFRRLT